MRVGIVGLGCIGSVIAKYLSQDKSILVHYFSKTPKTNISIKQLNSTKSLSVQLSKPSTFKTELDWIFICLKKYHYQEAQQTFGQLINPKTKVVVLRNGLNLRQDFLEYTNRDKILETIIDSPINRLSTNSYLQYRIPKFFVEKTKLSEAFKHLLRNTEIEIVFTKDFKTAQWKKLIESVCSGSIQTITRRKAEVFRDPKIQSDLRQCISESVKVAINDGAKLQVDFELELFNKIINYPLDKSNSMLNDLNNNQPLEINAKIGIIHKMAIEYKIQLQIIEQIYSSVYILNKDLVNQ